MALVRWEPVTMNRLITNLFDTPTGAGAAGARRWIPAMDLAESEDAYVLRADLPGLDPSAVSIELQDRVLTISGERASEHEVGYHRVERAFGAFRRSLTLPEGVDAEAITASFDQGVLTVRVPKPEERKPRRVEIAVEGKAQPAVEAGEPQAA
ncbi:MAG TPA: Hsp20/alpha crystallin family protein [Capillimicrobium sp.]